MLQVQAVTVREVRRDDDFGLIRSLLEETARRLCDDGEVRYAAAADELRDKFVRAEGTNHPAHRAFVAEAGGLAVAFLAVTVQDRTNNGILGWGVQAGCEHALTHLLPYAETIVRRNGGGKLLRYTPADFGQIRNREIAFWERNGFMAEEYFRVNMSLILNKWDVPGSMRLAGISAEPEFDVAEAVSLFRVSGDEWLAEYLTDQFCPKQPNHVFLTLRGPGDELLGLACYEAAGAPGDREPTAAFSFGVFFHPGHRIEMAEKRRLLHAALRSVKELGLGAVNAVFSSKSFDTLSILLAEGFEKPGTSLIVIERHVE